MLITIQNENLSLTVDTLGAQMMSIKSADGTEYLWQGDPKYWADRSPNIFPFVGRLTKDSCSYRGKVYPMCIHGFAKDLAFVPVSNTAQSVTLELASSDETKKMYPFDFTFRISYVLQGSTIAVGFKVCNLDEKTMPFAVGGHPGFNVPLVEGECFEDYSLEFSQVCQPDLVGFTPAVYLSGVDTVYPLEDGRRIPLRHDLFDADAVVLKNVDHEVTLRSGVSGRGVRVSYPDLPIIGFWHWPKTDAPYVCIEPWSSMPSRQDIIEELDCKSDMLRLNPGCIYDTTWTITVF